MVVTRATGLLLTKPSSALHLRQVSQMRTHGMFTLGGFLATAWRPSQPLLPWALTSALLTTAAMWGHWTTGQPVDWVVLGLAAYELMMGLLDVDERRSLVASSRASAAHTSNSKPVG